MDPISSNCGNSPMSHEQKHRRVEIASRLDERRDSLHDCLERLLSDENALVRGYYFDDESIDTLSTRFERGSEAIYKSLQRIRHTLTSLHRSKNTSGALVHERHFRRTPFSRSGCAKWSTYGSASGPAGDLSILSDLQT